MNDLEYASLSKMVKKANRRLLNLQKYTGRDVSWAGLNLQSRLDNEKSGAWSENNLIKISETMSDIQLQRLYRATESFLKSKTSLITGVKKTVRKTIKEIGKGIDVSEAEAEALYRSLTEDTFKWANKYAGASEIWAVIEEAKEYNLSRKKFKDIMLDLMQIESDVEVSKNIKNLYERYVKE